MSERYFKWADAEDRVPSEITPSNNSYNDIFKHIFPRLGTVANSVEHWTHMWEIRSLVSNQVKPMTLNKLILVAS